MSTICSDGTLPIDFCEMGDEKSAVLPAMVIFGQIGIIGLPKRPKVENVSKVKVSEKLTFF